MNIKTKLLLSIGLLTGMIILLVSLSVIYLQMLTAAEPDSPIASTGLKQAVVWVAIIGGICIVCGVTLAIWLPQSINRPIKELTDGILEIANRNYEKRLNISDKNEEFKNVVDSFNRMAQHLSEYRSTTLSTLLAHKKFLYKHSSPSLRNFSLLYHSLYAYCKGKFCSHSHLAIYSCHRPAYSKGALHSHQFTG